MPKELKTQTPGEITQQDPVETEPAAEETVTVSKSELAALMARVNALESRPAASRAVKEENLPDQDSIDVSKLKRPVLTKQGWLVPEKYGSNPNAPK
jgi:hypothetical protein